MKLKNLLMMKVLKMFINQMKDLNLINKNLNLQQ